MENYIIKDKASINEDSRKNTIAAFSVLMLLCVADRKSEKVYDSHTAMDDYIQNASESTYKLLNRDIAMADNKQAEEIQEQLITIYQNWPKVRSSQVLQSIANYFDRPGNFIDYIIKFYLSDKNTEIFDIQSVLNNVIKNKIENKTTNDELDTNMKTAFSEHMNRIEPIAFKNADRVLSLYQDDDEND